MCNQLLAYYLAGNSRTKLIIKEKRPLGILHVLSGLLNYEFKDLKPVSGFKGNMVDSRSQIARIYLHIH